MTSTAVGKLVVQRGTSDIARIAEIAGGQVRLELFESAAHPVSESRWVPVTEVQRVRLGTQTRVFFQDGQGRWRAGRVIGGGPDVYYVRLPNIDVDFQLPESRLRVRWERPTHDPLQVLLSQANETPRYRDVREPVRRLLLAERRATASATGVMSAGVRLHAHQISAALRIIRDPVQRYLLADEVGMGKTIQAGFVMRQLLLDSPGRRIGIIVPDALVGQWRSELLDKFYLDDFPLPNGRLPFQIVPHSKPDRWDDLLDVDMLVIDEAHLLARTTGPVDSPYRELAMLAHRAPRLLMLSATPFSRNSSTHLALLNLLDPQLFRWEDREEFERLLEARRELAVAIFSLDEEPDADNPELLQLQFDEILNLVPHDVTLSATVDDAMQLFGPPGTDPETVDIDALRRSVAIVRTHVSETYRLHHRVIRNRRHNIEMERLDDDGLLTPFEFAGRKRPSVLRLDAPETDAAASLVAQWATGVAAAVLDDELDPAPYGLALGVLVSRTGGPASDLLAALEYRVRGLDTDVLQVTEKVIMDAAPALPLESNLTELLRDSVGMGGLVALAARVKAACKVPGQAIVFCGRGALAAELAARLRSDDPGARVHELLHGQSEEASREEINRWRSTGGILITDESGDVGHNFQDATLVIHARIPWNANSLEQRIGRVDRYSNKPPATQFVIADADVEGIPTAWMKVLANGFGVFTNSISAMQEVVGDLARDVWSTMLTDGIEGFLASSASIQSELLQEKRRINEIDALESSYGTHADGAAMALAIAQYEDKPDQIERPYRQLIEGAEGIRLHGRENSDGSITFERHPKADPLLSARLLVKLMTVDNARSGFFDRWKLKPTRRLFRRGNPFIDGLEKLLAFDDRGQAAAMWRRYPGYEEPHAFFGFDFIVEADIEPIVDAIGDDRAIEPIARRRADNALRPQQHRIWVSTTSSDVVENSQLAAYLSLPMKNGGRDTNLNPERISALHTVVGGEKNFEVVARSCYQIALDHLQAAADLIDVCDKAADNVRTETERVLAQSRARSQAAGLVGDPRALDAEVAIGRAIEKAVMNPTTRLTTVSCVILSAHSWSDYVA
ncbi:ATP-dependent helicase HepA [Rhodococcus ruber]|uniref:protein DpdE n=1 Tax=Rhodococcus ruber TaxID=1830 RepID=UPI001AEB3569|nr:protein DpdE [Rhodococcus ruber]MBP2210858.1 ATP-dependent helicase HepA [Rhodococcus ruber]